MQTRPALSLDAVSNSCAACLWALLQCVWIVQPDTRASLAARCAGFASTTGDGSEKGTGRTMAPVPTPYCPVNSSLALLTVSAVWC